jgi:nucleoside-diphosphate-sugar epimerase
MKFLIIGGSRFIGPVLVKKLLSAGHELVLFNRGILGKTPDGAEHVKGDRNNGFSGVEGHFDTIIDTCAYNGEHTRQAIEALDFDFFLHFGTAAAYEKTGSLPYSEDDPLGPWPIWGDYNKGKVECERVLESSGIDYASIRPVYLLGPDDYTGREQFLFSKIEKGEEIIIPGDGKARMQFVFSDDVAEAFALIGQKQISGAFNCAGDDVVDLITLVKKMAEAAGKEAKIGFNPDANGINFNQAEFPYANEEFRVTNDKIKNLGISFRSLDRGLKENYDSFYYQVGSIPRCLQRSHLVRSDRMRHFKNVLTFLRI